VVNLNNGIVKGIVKVLAPARADRDKLLGTAFLVNDRFLLTAKHVVRKSKGPPEVIYKPDEISLRTGHRAWPDGGDRKVLNIKVHKSQDVALLELSRAADRDALLSLCLPNTELYVGNSVVLFGFPEDEYSGIEPRKADVIRYDGLFNLDFVDSTVSKGFSGGPAIHEKLVVGITILRDPNANKAAVLPASAFRDFVTHHLSQPVTGSELSKLKNWLKNTDISDELGLQYFHLVAPDADLSDEFGHGSVFFQILDELAQKPVFPPAQAPLLSFLECCRLNLPPGCWKQDIAPWMRNIATRLKIDLTTVQKEVETKRRLSFQSPKDPIIMVNVEPKAWVSRDKFQLRAWRTGGGLPDKGYDHKPDSTRETLSDDILEVLSDLIVDLKMTPRLELILPLCLFDWNPNEIEIPFGGTTNPSSLEYPLVVRSWDRLFNANFRLTQHRWYEKWKSLPTNNLRAANVHCLFDSTLPCEDLKPDLENRSIFVFSAMFPLPWGGGHVEDLFGTALAAGLPFMFWPIHWPQDNVHPDFNILKRSILNWTRRTEVTAWPERLFEKRRPQRIKSRKVQLFWTDLMLLWDNPKHLPPPLWHPLQPPQE
jgi:hypothetical protein